MIKSIYDSMEKEEKKMNLKGIYEIFYPGKAQKYPSVWKRKKKYCSKKDFFEEIFPMELRWLSIKLWNDKARRSRFFTDSKIEKNYISMLRNYILQNPMVISRMENKCYLMLRDDLFPHLMNQIFFSAHGAGTNQSFPCFESVSDR